MLVHPDTRSSTTVKVIERQNVAKVTGATWSGKKQVERKI